MAIFNSKLLVYQRVNTVAPSPSLRLVAELLPLRRGAHHGEAVRRRQKVPHFAGRGGCGLVEAMGKPWENHEFS